jgi:hypothetical protein
LSDLSETHAHGGASEHDASLSRFDHGMGEYVLPVASRILDLVTDGGKCGGGGLTVDMPEGDLLAALRSCPPLSHQTLIDARKRRIQSSIDENPCFLWSRFPTFFFSSCLYVCRARKEQGPAGLESAFLANIFGRGPNDLIPADQLYEFLLHERLPASWSKRGTTITNVRDMLVKGVFTFMRQMGPTIVPSDPRCPQDPTKAPRN